MIFEALHRGVFFEMWAEAFGGMIITYPLTYLVIIIATIGKNIYYSWHLLGLVTASLLHILILLITADINHDISYIPFEAARSRPNLYYLVAFIASAISIMLTEILVTFIKTRQQS